MFSSDAHNQVLDSKTNYYSGNETDYGIAGEKAAQEICDGIIEVLNEMDATDS